MATLVTVAAVVTVAVVATVVVAVVAATAASLMAAVGAAHARTALCGVSTTVAPGAGPDTPPLPWLAATPPRPKCPSAWPEKRLIFHPWRVCAASRCSRCQAATSASCGTRS